MSAGAAGGGDFNSRRPGRKSDSYYKHKQVGDAGGGGPFRSGGYGFVLIIIVIVFIIAAVYFNLVSILITIAIVAVMSIILYFTLKYIFAIRKKRAQLKEEPAADKERTLAFAQPNKPDAPVHYNPKDSYPQFERIRQQAEDERELAPEWEGGTFLKLVYISEAKNKTPESSVTAGDKLVLRGNFKKEIVSVSSQIGTPLGFIQKKSSVMPLALMKTGHELFARLHSKVLLGNKQSLLIEIFVRKQESNKKSTDSV